MAQVDLKVRSVSVNVTDIGAGGKVVSSKSASFTGIFAKARTNVSSNTDSDTTKIGTKAVSVNGKSFTTQTAKKSGNAAATTKSATKTQTANSQKTSSDSLRDVSDSSDTANKINGSSKTDAKISNQSVNDDKNDVVKDVDDNFSPVDEKDDGNDETSKRASEIFNELFTMLSSIADTLGINLKDVTDYVKSENLTSGDLLDINSFKMIIVETDGLNDVSGLLTSEKGFSDLNSISNLVDNFLNSDAMKQLETGMTEGSIDVDSLLQNFSDVFDRVDEFLEKLMAMLDNGLSGNEALELFTSGKASEAMGNLAAFGTTENVNSKAEDEAAGTAKDAVMDVNPETVGSEEEANAGQETVAAPAEPENTNQSGTETNANADADPNSYSNLLNKASQEARTGHTDKGNVTLTQTQAFANIAQSVEELTQTEALPAGVTVKDIMDQIESQIKTIKYPERTSLEMVLHPENLGKVFINVTSHAGELKATLMVQNEAARNALQNQIVDLKLQFENQGLKVDNVEVMLANEGFFNNNGQSGQGADTQSNNHRRRVFNPDAGVSFTDTVSTEEANEAYTGEDVGNSVNLSA
ncbi:MAG: flagellar hook-length control protein FliK [Catonella sp.]|nr:flagellar hook-length control protein FliK [Catonella sp.]MDY6356179.1 flagellar hook-length control protein FliK [Catonella sp.]